MSNGKLQTCEQAKEFTRQHRSPCSDCPWKKDSLPGWLGGLSVSEWLRAAHSDARIECHTRKDKTSSDHWQCAGVAIYRAHICKSPRDPRVLALPASPTVFGWGGFEQHHNGGKHERER